jgi:hypothetical protein
MVLITPFLFSLPTPKSVKSRASENNASRGQAAAVISARGRRKKTVPHHETCVDFKNRKTPKRWSKTGVEDGN